MCFTGKTRGAICLELDELGEMAFLSDQYLRAIFFFAVGGVSAIVILKIWENKEYLRLGDLQLSPIATYVTSSPYDFFDISVLSLQEHFSREMSKQKNNHMLPVGVKEEKI